MKKITVLIFAVLMSFPVFAQKQERLSIDLGLKAGANFSMINGKYWENGYKANFLGGAFLGINVGKLGGQIEGVFSQGTYATGEDFHDFYGDFYNNIGDSLKQGSFRVNYLSIPVLLNIRLFPRATIQIGPQYSGIVSVTDKDRLLKDAGDLFKSGSFDGVLGIWLNLPARINVGARYIIGFSDINNIDGNSVQKIDDAWKKRSLQVHIGYSVF